MIEGGPVASKWYQKWWGVVFIGVGALVLTVVVIFAVITARYWWQIKHGGAAALEKQFAGSFSVSEAGQGFGGLSTIDRSQLENPASQTVGRPGAPTVIVEFADFKCPNCRAADPILDKVMQQYGYKTQLIVRHFPADSLHPGATEVGHLVHCAGEQNAFWGVADYIYARQDELPVPLTSDWVAAIAAAGGIDASALATCMQSDSTKEAVDRDYFDGLRFGVRGTPTFFVNGKKVEGVIPFEVWEQVLGEK